MRSQSYRDLIVWQKAMDLAEEIYRLTKNFPKEEVYGLTSQMRRAGVSIACNIAEGQGRAGDAEFVRFLRIAHGSLSEIETQLLLSRRLELAPMDTVDRLLESASEVGRLLHGLIRSKS